MGDEAQAMEDAGVAGTADNAVADPTSERRRRGPPRVRWLLVDLALLVVLGAAAGGVVALTSGESTRVPSQSAVVVAYQAAVTAAGAGTVTLAPPLADGHVDRGAVLFRVGDRGRSAVVRAPVAGTLAAVLAPVGTAVSAGETLAVLVPARRMEVVAMVSEDQIRLVHVGDTATVALASDPGHTIDGRVLAIWPLTAQTYIGQSGVPAPPAEEFLKQTALVPVAVSLDAMPSGTVSGGSAEVTIDVGS